MLSETFSSVGHVLPEKTTQNMERQQVTDNVVSALCKSCSEVEIIYILPHIAMLISTVYRSLYSCMPSVIQCSTECGECDFR